jgi:26S proteasome regulatory subunit N9
MALLELIFSLPKNDRNVNFNAIAKVTNLNNNEIEPLLMRSMSLGLIKGHIDEVGRKKKFHFLDWEARENIMGCS